MNRTNPARTGPRANDADRYISARLRARRIMMGLSQQQLADLIGVTYQQTHKYENGTNRITAGRLFEISRVLSVQVDYFFDGIEDGRGAEPTKRQRMCLELARNFAAITDETHQESLALMARALAGHEK